MNDKEISTELKILEAAEKEFLTKGYAGARTTSIAEAAGVTHAMMHYYYRTKDKLFEKILNDKVEAICEIVIGSIGDESLSLRDRVRTAVERHFDFIAANPLLPRFIISEVFSKPERMQMIFDRLRQTAPQAVMSLQAHIDRSADAGECRNVDATMLMLDITSLNIFSFLAAPMIRHILGDMIDYQDFVTRRRNENIETIMRKLFI